MPYILLYTPHVLFFTLIMYVILLYLGADQARKLLYRAQDNNRSAMEIYDQLFRIELIHACQLRKRLEITGSLQNEEKEVVI